MAKPLTEILSPAAWGALQLGLAALQDQKEDKVALDYMAKLLRYLAFIWDQLSLWSRLLWFFACICIKLGLWGRLPSRWRHKLRAIGCIHSLRDSITTGCPPADINLLFYDCRCLFSAKSGWVRGKSYHCSAASLAAAAHMRTGLCHLMTAITFVKYQLHPMGSIKHARRHHTAMHSMVVSFADAAPARQPPLMLATVFVLITTGPCK